MTRAQRSVAALAVVVASMGVIVVAVRASYGAFRSGYHLIGVFPRADYGVEPGVQVEHHGIAVGKVDSVHLVNHEAELHMTIFGAFRVPASVNAAIRPRSIFGDPYVDLAFSDGAPGPFLADGERLARTASDSETGDLIASAVPLLQKINPQDLTTVIDELSKASAGEGQRIASSIDNGSKLAALFASTIDAQLQAIDALAQFQAAFTPTGPSLNAIAANSNVALPTLNAAQADFQRALDSLTAFSSALANFLAQVRPDMTRLLEAGDNVVRLLTIREPQLEQVVSGLAQYVFKFAAGRSPQVLPNGSRFAYFKNFILFSDINTLVCGLIAPAEPGLGFLQPLQQAVGSSGVFDCSKYFTTPGRAGAVPSPAAIANELSEQLDGVLGVPEVPQRSTVESIVDQVLGRS
jgi:phospholipid/cholesterol/gamma-HCH transport system substrate-binding protein